MNNLNLSTHFTVAEFCNLQKYPQNIPTIQQITNMAYGCRNLLDPAQFQRLISFLKACEFTDQLLTGNGWLHISWRPFGVARHYIRIGYYK